MSLNKLFEVKVAFEKGTKTHNMFWRYTVLVPTNLCDFMMMNLKIESKQHHP